MLDASRIMHDVDYAVEQGRDGNELTPAEQRKADIANLALAIAQVADKASSRSSSGGLLAATREFNAFLERAATALESR